MKRTLPYALLIAFVVILDQVTKVIVVRSIGLHDYVPLVDGLLSLSHVRNHGAPSGCSPTGTPYQSLMLSTLSLLALVAIAAYFVHLPARARLPRLALALVLGGAFGNVIDRLRLGYVVDFVHVYWRDYQWPDFNTADSAITIGVALLVIDILSLRAAGAARGPASTRPLRPGGPTDMHPRLLTLPVPEFNLLGCTSAPRSRSTPTACCSRSPSSPASGWPRARRSARGSTPGA